MIDFKSDFSRIMAEARACASPSSAGAAALPDRREAGAADADAEEAEDDDDEDAAAGAVDILDAAVYDGEPRWCVPRFGTEGLCNESSYALS